MLVLQCILICGFLIFPSKSTKPDGTSIDLIAKYADRNLVLICEIRSSHVITYLTYLKCPFGENKLCFTNCKNVCSNKTCKSLISRCSTSDNGDKFRQIEWTIDLLKVNQTGNWQCTHGDKSSNTITVEKHSNNFLVESTLKPEIITTKTTEAKPEIPATISDNDYEKSRKSLVKPPIYHETNNEFWSFITNPNVVLILVCVFSASLLFNIIFLIRCALLRSLIDQYLQSNKISDSCLYRCFCIRIKSGLPLVNNKKSTPSMNQGNIFMGYHRDDVYDDMSASSQAERHLISNYSQYELDQETMLARKIYAENGSQCLVGRQPQFYQGQPMGNYVIVSGPVCSNRSHGPFSTVSNTSYQSSNQRTGVHDGIGRSPSNELNKTESPAGNESVIYSQPMKIRPKSFCQYQENDVTKAMETCPPAPPIRTCTDSQCYLTASICSENIQPSIAMKNVDLIEHCAHSTINNTPQENHL